MGISGEQLAARLTLPVDQSTDEILDEIKRQEEKPVAPTIREDDPRLHEEYTFQFKWANARGRSWGGEFTNKILSIKDRRVVGIMRAKLAGLVPMDALDGLTLELNLMIAHMSVSLVKRPSWADDLQNLRCDVRLVQALYQEVTQHEATFHGWDLAEAGGEKGV